MIRELVSSYRVIQSTFTQFAQLLFLMRPLKFQGGKELGESERWVSMLLMF